MPHIILELTHIQITVGPLVRSLAIFLVILEKALVLITNLIHPLTFPVSQPVDKIAFVRSPVLPNVMAVSIGFSVSIVAFVDVTIVESLMSISVFLEGVELPLNYE